MTRIPSPSALDSFVYRHIGPRPPEIEQMLGTLGLCSLDDLVNQTVPASIRPKAGIQLKIIGPGRTEPQVLAEIREMLGQNQVFRSFIGMGYSDCYTPTVIQRNILENPCWYTPYTPYQSEVSQGRLEALLNFQTMIMDLTGMDISNASLLDEATAAAEAMHVCLGLKGKGGRAFFVSQDCHPQTIAVVKGRAEPLGVEIIVGDHRTHPFDTPICGMLLQYPATDGVIYDYRSLIDRAHAEDALVVVAADILSLALLTPPGELGADIVVGSTQRFGVPMGYGGPHAAYLATRDEFKRHIPGRLVGVSKDADGNPGVRLALQTREQHIRRDKATSNICTAQVLLAVMASMYAVYHGPEGIREIAGKVHFHTTVLQAGLERLGYPAQQEPYFDTLRIPVGEDRLSGILRRAEAAQINLRLLNGEALCISLDETTGLDDVEDLLNVFSPDGSHSLRMDQLLLAGRNALEGPLARTTPFLTHPVFNTHHSETEMLRYLKRLQDKDISLATSMIPLGSCTMKLNATTEMIPVTWPEVSQMHPFAPPEQAKGYRLLTEKLEAMLAEITGFAAVSLQPNAGSQGEYAGLLVIRKFHLERGEGERNVCLIPQSAHGTNPASAAMAGMKIVVVHCDDAGNIDLADLRAKAEEHGKDLSALMVTYPSTHGVFEEGIVEICEIVHEHGGQVYMDGANMNAQVGLCRPGDFGADVCHLNLHKTFCIPHGGGGPGVGPIGVVAHLVPYLPTHSVVPTGGSRGIPEISAAPWGSASILPISYAYIALMGEEGLPLASKVAILNANYIARRLEGHYSILYKGKNGFAAHECIVDVRKLKGTCGVEVEDIAKRLIDYGFHAPTVSWPVAGTLMVEPTESESKEELDRFCDAMIAIREEIAEIERGEANRQDNLLKNAPHTAAQVTRDEWNHPYSRERAAYPAPWVREAKYWPPVARIDNVYGERNIVCSCLPIEEYR